MHHASVWMSSLVMATAAGWFAATMFAAPATSKEPRFPQLTMDQLDEKQKPLGEQRRQLKSANQIMDLVYRTSEGLSEG